MLTWNYVTYEPQIGANKLPASEMGVTYFHTSDDTDPVISTA